MKTSFISTYNLLNVSRLATANTQSQLADASKELSTGRKADVGLSLGAETGQSVMLRQQQDQLDALTDSNSLASSRLDTTQSALSDIASKAQSFLESLLGSEGQDTGASGVQIAASENLQDLVSALNTGLNGQYIFGGINSGTKPVADYTSGSAASTAVASAFFNQFGMTQSDPNVSNISASDMQNFLDNSFSDLFNSSNWKSNWSSASDTNVTSQISPTQNLQTSVNANDQAFRDVAMAYTMVADLGTANLSDATRQVVTNKAIEILGKATSELTSLQTGLGTAQSQVEQANTTMSTQKDIITKEIGSLEDVDPYEAQSRLSALQTQLEVSYNITSRLQQLSLVNYLS